MDPRHNNNEGGAFKLPEVQPLEPVAVPETQAGDMAAVSEKDASQRIEQAPVAPPTNMPTANPVALPTDVPFGMAPAQPVVAAPATQSTPPPTSNLQARDTDLIEKEWVIKAKAIVEKTKNNPYEQNEQVNRIKADYIKKRYNKDIKIN
jgi:hypothetical protein